MPRRLKICYIQPEGGSLGADPEPLRRRGRRRRAGRQRPRHARASAGSGRPRAAVERFKLWENGRTLRVRFLDGEPVVQQKVEAIAKEWEAVANLTLQFVTSGAAELRDQLRRAGLLVVDGRHRRPDRAAHAADDELRLARAGHGHPRVPAGRASRVRPCPRHDPRAPEPRRRSARSRGTSRRCTPTTPSRAGRARTSTSTSSTSTTRTSRTSRRSTRPRSCSTPCPTR